ncbi:MAG: superoxide dismutase [Methylophaga sp.]|nr:MAG: superoxide dismutase [Methylophaga sp.]
MLKNIRKSILLKTIAIVGLSVLFSAQAYAHCQIPCGIFNDHARIQTMLEDVTTIEKSTNLIVSLAGKSDAQSQNQLVRWVMNKEEHAQNIIEVSADYFLAQRLKPSQEGYTDLLVKHHAVIIAAMKAKQNTDKEHISALLKSIEALAPHYPEHKH